MKKSILLFSMFLGTLFPCCKTAKYTPTDYPDMQIVFGKGGGMSNSVNEHSIFQNGTVYHRNGMQDATFEKKGKLTSNVLNQLIANFETLKIGESKFSHPGNRYSYIEIKNGPSPTRITWGDQNIPVPKKIELFYNLLNHHVSNL